MREFRGSLETDFDALSNGFGGRGGWHRGSASIFLVSFFRFPNATEFGITVALLSILLSILILTPNPEYSNGSKRAWQPLRQHTKTNA